MKSRLTDLELMIHGATEAAVLVSTDDEIEGAVWLPMSAILLEANPVPGIAQVITLPESLATEKGLV